MKLKNINSILWMVFITAFIQVKNVFANEAVIVEIGVNDSINSQSSLIELLLFSDLMDIRGIIISFPDSQNKIINTENPLKIFQNASEQIYQTIEAYKMVYPNLCVHSKNFLHPDTLLNRTVFNVGNYQKGSDLIIKNLLDTNLTHLWYLNWENQLPENSLLRALDIINKNGFDQLSINQACNKICYLGKYNQRKLWNNYYRKLKIILDTHSPDEKGQHWNEQWLTHTILPDSISRYLQSPLLKHYKPNKSSYLNEIMFLVTNRINVPLQPNLGGWGGRWGYIKKTNTYICNQSDSLNGTYGRLNTILRFGNGINATHIANHFLSRCIYTNTDDYKKANHEPIVVINRNRTTEPLLISAKPGQKITVDALATRDPDGNPIFYQWILYSEISDFEVQTPDWFRRKVEFIVPKNVKRGQICHLYLTATDNQWPTLTSYKRVVIKID